MGCGESKHAVATANTTVSKSSSSKRSRSINTKSLENNTTTVEKRLKSTIDENVNATPVQENDNVVKDSGNENVNIEKEIPDAVKKEEHEADKKEKQETADVQKEVDIVGKQKVVDEHGNEESGIPGKVEETFEVAVVKVVEEKKEGKNEELKELEEEKGDGVINVDHEEEQEEERLMVSHDSSNHLFSPKKDHHEETIESIIPDGISGESDNYSPRAKQHVPEGIVDGDDASEEKEVNGEAESSAEKAEEAIIVDEGKEVVPVDETEGSATAKGEEETPIAEKENANATT